jgi:predicted DNA-binding transcriptional regulator YafY
MAQMRKAQKTAKKTRHVGVRGNGAPNQAVRVVRILKWLHDNKAGLSVQDILAKLELDHGEIVVARQVNRDLKYIELAGIVLEKVYDGRTPRYYIPVNERVMALQNVQEGMNLAMQLLKDIMPQSSKVKVDKLMEEIHDIVGFEGDGTALASNDLMHSIHAGTWQRDVNARILSEAFAAVANRKNILVRYGSATQPEQLVFPCKITMYLERIYLIVYKSDVDDYFVYAIDKIHEIRSEPKGRVIKHRFDEEKFMATRFGIWSAIKVPGISQQTHKVVVKVLDLEGKPHLLEEFVGRSWHPSQEKKKLSDGSYQVTFQCGVSPELVSWVLRWAPQVQVIKPQFLKDLVRERAEKLLQTL